MRLIARDPSQMVNAGYPSLAHIPFLIGNDGTYPAIANRYIRVRALCEWTLQMGNDSSPSSDARRRFLTKASVNSVARHVGAFLDWCNSTGRDWQKLTYYEDLILGWQDGLLTGQSSKSQRPLAHKTVNKMVTEACYFLTWAGEEKRSLRPPFHVVVNETKIKFSRGTNAKGAGVKVNASRVGALPVKEKKPVLLPPPNDVGTWMRGMRARYTAKALMAELILETGIRVSECNEWRVDTLPERQFWQTRGGKIVVNLRYGIKGPKVALGSSESVNPREIEMPIALADKIDHYRTVTRPNQIARWIKAGKTKEERNRRSRTPRPQRLWLSEYSHQPFANTQFYRAWTRAPGCPAHWHPHRGREYFAVETVVDWLRRDLAARRMDSVPKLSWLQAVTRDQIRLLLTPLMGHVSDETTMIYLRCAHARLIQEYGHPALRWQAFCDTTD